MDGSFLQSGEWEDFQRSLGRKTWRAEGVLIIRHDTPRGMNYLYCPRPDTSRFTSHITRDTILREIEKIAARERSIFLKIDPVESLQVSGLRFQVSGSLQPQKTIILDLQKSERDLLSAMHEKTRYNIRLAVRKGVRITHATRAPQELVDAFWILLEETVRRDRFCAHERRHYERLLDAHSDAFSNELFFAEYRGVPLAAALVNFHQPSRVATYLHGASSRMHKEVMASQLLHWEIAREAKRRGSQYYDFWGIDEKKWPGLTRFKRGFGGFEFSRPESADIVYRPAIYRAAQLWKKFWRR